MNGVSIVAVSNRVPAGLRGCERGGAAQLKEQLVGLAKDPAGTREGGP